MFVQTKSVSVTVAMPFILRLNDQAIIKQTSSN